VDSVFTMSNESRELERLHEGFRFFSYLLLFLSLYITQIHFFKAKGFYIPEFEAIIEKIIRMDFLAKTTLSKTVCLVFLVITCIGTKSKKDRDLKVSTIVLQVVSGLILYWGSLLLFEKHPPVYLILTFSGFVILNVGFDNLSKLINVNLMKDRFNWENESFPQEQKIKENEFSVNLASQYQYKNRTFEGWINVVNPFRGTMVIGTPGSGKSFSVVLPFIKQHLAKGFSMCVYDF